MFLGCSLEHKLVSRAEVCIFVREDICSHRLGSFEDRKLSLSWARIDYEGHTYIYACLYRSHSGDSVIDRLIGYIHSKGSRRNPAAAPLAEVLGDFNAHYIKWLESTRAGYVGRAVRAFAAAYEVIYEHS